MTKRAIMEAVETNFPKKYEQLDIAEETKSLSQSLSEKSYNFLSSKAPFIWDAYHEITNATNVYSLLKYAPLLEKGFEKIIKKYQPDMFVMTIPVLDKFIVRALKNLKQQAKVVVMVTDTGKVHKMWINKEVDHYLVGSEDTGEYLTSRGISKSKVHFLGFPVRQVFYKKYNKFEEQKKLGLEQGKRTILVLGWGANPSGVLERVVSLDKELQDIQIIVACGKHLNLKEKINNLETKNRVLPIGFTNDVAGIIASSDLVLTRAGGATFMELITMKKPMVIFGTLSCEKPNAQMVEHLGFGIICKSEKKLGSEVKKIFAEDLLSRFEKNLQNYMANDHADQRISHFIDSVLNGDKNGRGERT